MKTNKKEYISTGSRVIDNLTNGGIVKEKISAIFGNESSGKKTLAYNVIANAQKENIKCAYIDTKMYSLNYEYAKNLKVNVDELIYSKVNDIRDILVICNNLIRLRKVKLIVLNKPLSLIEDTKLEKDLYYNLLKMCLHFKCTLVLIEGKSKKEDFSKSKNKQISFITIYFEHMINLYRKKKSIDECNYCKDSIVNVDVISSFKEKSKEGKLILTDNLGFNNDIYIQSLKQITKPYSKDENEFIMDEDNLFMNKNISIDKPSELPNYLYNAKSIITNPIVEETKNSESQLSSKIILPECSKQEFTMFKNIINKNYEPVYINSEQINKSFYCLTQQVNNAHKEYKDPFDSYNFENYNRQKLGKNYDLVMSTLNEYKNKLSINVDEKICQRCLNSGFPLCVQKTIDDNQINMKEMLNNLKILGQYKWKLIIEYDPCGIFNFIKEIKEKDEINKKIATKNIISIFNSTMKKENTCDNCLINGDINKYECKELVEKISKEESKYSNVDVINLNFNGFICKQKEDYANEFIKRKRHKRISNTMF